MSSSSPPKPPPCKETICSTKKDALKSMLAAQSSKPGPSTPAAPCPPDREELGRHTWTLVRTLTLSLNLSRSLTLIATRWARRPFAHQMHTLAAYFPEKPTTAEREAATSFLHVLGGLYPCGHCAEDFRTSLDESPPR